MENLAIAPPHMHWYLRLHGLVAGCTAIVQMSAPPPSSTRLSLVLPSVGVWSMGITHVGNPRKTACETPARDQRPVVDQSMPAPPMLTTQASLATGSTLAGQALVWVKLQLVALASRAALLHLPGRPGAGPFAGMKTGLRGRNAGRELPSALQMGPCTRAYWCAPNNS